jgi:putative ABC transport system permease protein
MNFREVIRVALRALARNKMRTVLAMLGIIIGVGAVICTVAIGQSAGRQVQSRIQNLGTNLVMVFAGINRVQMIKAGAGAEANIPAAQEQISSYQSEGATAAEAGDRSYAARQGGR